MSFKLVSSANYGLFLIKFFDNQFSKPSLLAKNSFFALIIFVIELLYYHTLNILLLEKTFPVLNKNIIINRKKLILFIV